MDNFILRKENCGYILYDLQNNTVFLADSNIGDIYCENNYKPLSRNTNIALPNNYFINNHGRYIDNTKYSSILSAPQTVFLEVTKKCNLKCQHCFNDSGVRMKSELSFQEIKSLLDDIARSGVFTIKITGGEPFCRKDIIDILYYLDSKSINYIIYSNGTCISANDIGELKQLKHLLKLRISIDGIRETNDSIRGVGTFEKSISTIKQLCTHGIPCEINYTITKANYMQIGELAKYLNDNNINCKINIGMVKVSGRAKNKSEEYYFSESNITNAILYIKKQLLCSKLIKPYYLLEPIYYKLFGNSFGCPAGRLTATIKCTGEIYPCGLLTGFDTFMCGNIKDNSFQDIWNNNKMEGFRHLLEPEKCKRCHYYLKTCTGACRGNAFNYYNDICGEDINCLVYQVNFNMQGDNL